MREGEKACNEDNLVRGENKEKYSEYFRAKEINMAVKDERDVGIFLYVI